MRHCVYFIPIYETKRNDGFLLKNRMRERERERERERGGERESKIQGRVNRDNELNREGIHAIATDRKDKQFDNNSLFNTLSFRSQINRKFKHIL